MAAALRSGTLEQFKIRFVPAEAACSQRPTATPANRYLRGSESTPARRPDGDQDRMFRLGASPRSTAVEAPEAGDHAGPFTSR